MKLVKLSVFALTMGLFVASCGNGGDAAKTADTTAAPTPTATETPAPAAPATPDTMTAAPAKPATEAAAPAADAKKEEKKK